MAQLPLEERGSRRQPISRLARRVAWIVVPLALLGELGHQLLGRLGQTLAHHLFHILFAGGAAVLFIAYVAVEIRRHGWPTFSWRLRLGGPGGFARRIPVKAGPAASDPPG